jgi:predicted Ser/Thr protein kinase
MATVYRAFDPRFDREVAVKVLPREMMHDPQFRSRFEREIKMIAQLEHPAIVPVYDVGDVDEQPYFVMRFMMGGSLSDRIAEGSIPIDETAKIIEKIAQGLSYAHRKGIIHRDLKPDNILFDENGEPFISDFGVAKLSESASNLTGSGVIGTPAYMSPEQAQGQVIDMRSDVYGLGVIVYQMLSGQQPYSADTPMGIVVKHITDPVPEILKVLPNLPADVDAVIKTAMAKNRDDRYPNTIELAKALNMIAFGTTRDLTFTTNGSGVMRPIKPGTNKTQLSRGQTTGLIVVVVALLLVAIGAFLLRNQLFAPEPTATVAAATESEAQLQTATPILLVVTATLEQPTATLGSTFAPACSADVNLPAPLARETDNFCVQKIPYAYALTDEDAVYNVLNTDGSRCRVESVKNGEKVLSCTGPSFALIELEVCEVPELSEQDLAQCSTDNTYNTANQCCIQLPPEKAACKTIKIQLKGCGG